MNFLPLCYIIEAKTSYDLLLEKTWLHENGVVPSTLHQCFKYSHGGEVKCVVDIKESFSIEESYYTDVRFYFEEDEELKLEVILNFKDKIK
jgi:hypothetical protein